MKYDPNDPRFYGGGEIKIAVIGGGTGLANLLRGLKKYSRQISAIVTVTDGGASTGILRREFDVLPPGDIRKCISALAYDEELIANIFEYRFSKEKIFGGHTLGNIWITALSKYLGSFEKAIQVTTELFQTAGRVLPATLDNIDLIIQYEDGSTLLGEENLDKLVKPIKGVSLNKPRVRACPEAVLAIREADLVILGPGSLYGSLVPNLLIGGIRRAIEANNKAIKIYIANCSTERTQTSGYSIADHIEKINYYCKNKLFRYCLVNNRIVKKTKNERKLGEINNISTNEKEIFGCKIMLADVVNIRSPLFHDSAKLAKEVIALYNRSKGKSV